jgi:cyclophilin family peptidyl-prolyl cis-trans isomerase
MKKVLYPFILLAFVFILYACSPTTATSIPASGLPSTLQPSATPAIMPCTVLHFPATPEALGAEFGNRGHVTGPADAPVTIVVFGDYQCPACAFLEVSLKQIRLTHPNDVRLVFINTPQADHDKDALSMQAAEAADLQGKFWEMHDLLFAKQAEWSALAPGEFEAWAVEQATGLGMDPVRFKLDFQGEVVTGRLQEAVQSAITQPITLPKLFVNRTSPYTGLADFPSLDEVVRMEALTARQFSACPDWVIDPLKQYVVTLHTSKGDVLIQLFPDKAPLAVNNFIFLARKGWYDGITFHRVVSNFIAQSGDPSGTGIGNPGYLFKTEIPAGLRFDKPGMVAMENSGANTNGSRFLITLVSATKLDGQYTIFGQVLSGLEVLTALSPRDPQPGVYSPPGDELIRVTIEER